jgi:hypothetical protein
MGIASPAARNDSYIAADPSLHPIALHRDKLFLILAEACLPLHVMAGPEPAIFFVPRPRGVPWQADRRFKPGHDVPTTSQAIMRTAAS